MPPSSPSSRNKPSARSTDSDQGSLSLTALREAAVAAIDAAGSSEALEQLRQQYLGKKGSLTAQVQAIGRELGEARAKYQALGEDAKGAITQRIEAEQVRIAAVAKLANDAKLEIVQYIETRQRQLAEAELEKRLAAERIDITQPGRAAHPGSLHPVTQTLQRLDRIFSRIGFHNVEGPEIEHDYYNFTALNIPPDHPARAMHDTFYTAGGQVLRTHTSPMQIRTMLQHGAPLRIIAAGKVYRCDSDLTHTPMFHQIEGLMVDRHVTFAELKGVLQFFVNEFFERDLPARFRPSYFPFTEPSTEMDIGCLFCSAKGCRVCGHSGWLEILGAGMVHPAVLQHAGLNPRQWSGYAFGVGVERLAMLRLGIDDLRMFFENDLEFLQQFGGAEC